jgi:hypothetical protein
MHSLARTSIITCFIAAISVATVSYVRAQSSLTYSWYLGIHGGISQLHGDIQTYDNPFKKLKHETGFGGGIKVGKYINSLFSAYLQVEGAGMKGRKRDTEFKSDLREARLALTLNLTNLFFRKKERTINFYGTAGAGIVFFRSQVSQISTGIILHDYGYIGTINREKVNREMTYYIPVGGGFDIRMSPQWYLNLESIAGIFMTDLMDATKKGTFEDAYNFTSLGLTYYFHERNKGRIPQSRPLEKKPEIAAETYANEYVNVTHQFPTGIKSLDEFVLVTEVHKGKIDGAGSLTQVLPVGFNVLDTAISGAKAEFNMYTLRLVWDQLPADSVFKVSYRVKIDKISGTLPLASILYLKKTDKEYRFRTNVNILPKEEPVVIVEPKPEPAPEPRKEDTIPSVATIEYRLQIAASYKARIPLRELEKKITPQEEIREDFQNNWYTYTLGSFETYKDAKDYINTRTTQHGLKEGYVVVFYEGKKLKSLGDLNQYLPKEIAGKPVVKKDVICYRVQIMAVSGGRVDPMSLKQKYKLEEDVNEEIYNNWHKYTVGPCSPISETTHLLEKVKSRGVAGAFMVTYKNGERVINR